MKKRNYQKELKAIIIGARSSLAYLVDGLPETAKTDEQRRLKRAHGSPKEFGLACLDAVGEISIEEARRAIGRYRAEWQMAGAFKTSPSTPAR